LDNALVGLTESARSPDDFRQEAVRTDEKGEKLISVGNGDHNARSGRGRTVLEYAELQTWAEGRKHHLEKAARDHAERQGVEQEARCIENEDAWEGHPSQAKLGDMVEGANRVIAQLLEMADGYRTTCHKALNLARAAVSLPSKPKGTSESHVPYDYHDKHTPAPAAGALDEPSPIVDPSDPAGAIDILRAFDHDDFLEAIKKTGSTIRKWQKQCKEYRERGKKKISFRNFAEGDLALFLPTRNSSRPWAAFNGAWDT
jgi:autophagy-related protein 11